MTLQVTLISILISTLLGVLVACLSSFQNKTLNAIIITYVQLLRNTPILVQLYFIFYGLPAIGLGLSIYWSGVLCLTVWGTAYQIENVRGGLRSVLPGLGDAAKALGLPTIYYFQLIALPIALRVSAPSMTNTAISLFKNSAYLQTIGLAELTFVAIDRASLEFKMVEMFTAILIIYLSLILFLSALARKLEARLNKPFGFGQ